MDSHSSNDGSNANVWKYIESRANRHADRILQVDANTGETLSFKQLSDTVRTVAASVRKLKIQGGIAICSENNLQFCSVLLGVLHAGVRCTLLAPLYTAREVRHFCHLAKPSMILCSKLVSEKKYEEGQSFYDVCSEFSCIQDVYVWGTDAIFDNYKTLSSLTNNVSVEMVEEESCTPEDQTCEQDREALVLASSGTTGLPKGVVLTHKAIVETLKMSPSYASRENVALGLMPFYHAYGLIISLVCLCEGSKFVVVPKFQGAKHLRDLITRHQINDLYIIPSLLTTIVKEPMFSRETLSSIRHIWTGAGTISKQIQERAFHQIPNATIHHTFGMTETTFLALTGNCEKFETVGKPVAKIECRIFHDGEICEPNVVGELQFRGPTLMKGYLNNDEATAETFIDGWLKTGDLAYKDADGDLFIVGRTKEIIKYQGYQVSPAEIDGIISMLPSVAEVAVVGLPDENFGELPAAGIVLNQGSTLTDEQVKDYVAKHVAPYKRLRGGIFFFDSLPKSVSGKIVRPAVLEMIKKCLVDHRRISIDSCVLNNPFKGSVESPAIDTIRCSENVC